MTVTMAKDDYYTTVIPVGKQFTVVTDASGGVIVERYSGDTLLEKETLSTSTTRVYGEYLVEVRFRFTCTAAGVTIDTSQDTGHAGAPGEFRSATVATASAVSLTTATAANVTSLSLTAGEWDVSAMVDRNLAGTTLTVASASISTTTGTMTTQAGGSGIGTDCIVTNSAAFTTVTGTYSQAIAPVRVVLAATTTIYLVAKDTFSAGTVGIFGTLRARRIR